MSLCVCVYVCVRDVCVHECVYIWVIAYIWMSHVTHMAESCHMNEEVQSNVWISHATRTKKWCHTKFSHERCHTKCSHEWARKCSTRCFFKFECVCFRCNDCSKCVARRNESCHMNEPGCYLLPLTRRQDEWMSHGMHVDASRDTHGTESVMEVCSLRRFPSRTDEWLNMDASRDTCDWVCHESASITYEWVCHVKVGEDP